MDAWLSADPYNDATAQSIGYALISNNTIWPATFNSIVFKRNGIYWETLTGANTATGYKYLANVATNNGYSLAGSAIIYSGELFVKQNFVFADATRIIYLNNDKSKFYWSYSGTQYGSALTSGLSVPAMNGAPASPTRNLNQMSWSSSTPLLRYNDIAVTYCSCMASSWGAWASVSGLNQLISANGILFYYYSDTWSGCG